ncbi:MAG: helix-turn-helix domain-containing protein [Rhodospirillales bacterium]|nr:helix-turn-helix domain-containing protein [Rhodospirillales bacterium]
MEAKKLVGWNVRKHRVARVMTLEDVAVAARTNASYVAEVERGEANIGIELLDKLARALDVKPADLFIEPRPGEKPPAPLKAGRRSQRQSTIRDSAQLQSHERAFEMPTKDHRLAELPGVRTVRDDRSDTREDLRHIPKWGKTTGNPSWAINEFCAAVKKSGHPQLIWMAEEMAAEFRAAIQKSAKDYAAKPPQRKGKTPERVRGGHKHHKAHGLKRGRSPH